MQWRNAKYSGQFKTEKEAFDKLVELRDTFYGKGNWGK